jgi:hypothetical protein
VGQLAEQPCPSPDPIALDGCRRRLDGAGSLLDREAAEESHDHEIDQSRVDRAELVQSRFQVQEVYFAWRCDRDVIGEGHSPSSAAALEGGVPTRMVHQDATHHTCRDREELDAVLPPYPAQIHETHVGLVDESCGCQGMIAAFGTEAPARDPPQICVHGLNQPTVCSRITIAPRYEPTGHVIVGHALIRRADCTPQLVGETLSVLLHIPIR